MSRGNLTTNWLPSPQQGDARGRGVGVVSLREDGFQDRQVHGRYRALTRAGRHGLARGREVEAALVEHGQAPQPDDGARATLADAERDRAIDTMRQLTHDGAPRRRWWPFGR